MPVNGTIRSMLHFWLHNTAKPLGGLRCSGMLKFTWKWCQIIRCLLYLSFRLDSTFSHPPSGSSRFHDSPLAHTRESTPENERYTEFCEKEFSWSIMFACEKSSTGWHIRSFPNSRFRASVKALAALNREFGNNPMCHPVFQLAQNCVDLVSRLFRHRGWVHSVNFEFGCSTPCPILIGGTAFRQNWLGKMGGQPNQGSRTNG